jgi:tyrosine decarboxylase/aspartate 1-decarboxylase
MDILHTQSRTAFPEGGLDDHLVVEELEALCTHDKRWENGRIFNSICTAPHPISVRAYTYMLGANAGDRRLFPSITRLEDATLNMLGDLLSSRECVGNVVSGATEGNLLALAAATQRAAGVGVDRPEIVVPVSGHYSLDKVGRYLGLKVVRTPVDDAQRADVQAMSRAITDRTVALVATAGTSEYGQVDPIPEIAALALRRGLPCHVDAASGGFLIPFARSLGFALPEFDFAVDGVSSIAIDPHKFGLAVIPAGVVLFRQADALAGLSVASHYVGTAPHTGLLGTRPGASAAGVYAVLRHLGWTGFLGIVQRLMDLREYFVQQSLARGYRLATDPDLTTVVLRSRHAAHTMRLLEEKGWSVSVSTRCAGLRFVIHQHNTRDSIDGVLDELLTVEGPFE